MKQLIFLLRWLATRRFNGVPGTLCRPLAAGLRYFCTPPVLSTELFTTFFASGKPEISRLPYQSPLYDLQSPKYPYTRQNLLHTDLYSSFARERLVLLMMYCCYVVTRVFRIYDAKPWCTCTSATFFLLDDVNSLHRHRAGVLKQHMISHRAGVLKQHTVGHRAGVLKQHTAGHRAGVLKQHTAGHRAGVLKQHMVGHRAGVLKQHTLQCFSIVFSSVFRKINHLKFCRDWSWFGFFWIVELFFSWSKGAGYEQGVDFRTWDPEADSDIGPKTTH